jgi:hypothetical protein
MLQVTEESPMNILATTPPSFWKQTRTATSIKNNRDGKSVGTPPRLLRMCRLGRNGEKLNFVDKRLTFAILKT